MIFLQCTQTSVCSGFERGGGSGRAGGGERTRPSHSVTTGTTGGQGWHGTPTMFTQVPLCGIQGAQTKADISATVKPAHAEGSRTECPGSRAHSKHTFSKRPLLYGCMELSLPSLLPAAEAEEQLQAALPYSQEAPSSSEGKQPALLCMATDPSPRHRHHLDHQHLVHSCCGCSWTVSPQGSAPPILYLLPKWCCLGVRSKWVSSLAFLKFLQASFPFFSAWPIVLPMLLPEGAVCVKPLLTGHCVPASIQRSRWPALGLVCTWASSG